ncbi:MAG: tRNA lysidine(34) synthetase TilS [Rickettsiales bacterium]
MQVAQAGFGVQVSGLETHLFEILDAILLTSRHPKPETRNPNLAVAVSGGADSMALTLLAQHWCEGHGIALTAFTVDHGLRSESATEAAQVAAWLAARGIAHRILTPPSLPAIRNPQAQARARRYGALSNACREIGSTHLLLAHHADDQAETVALQRHRGESPASHAGMALVRAQGGIHLVRPLLGVRKSALVNYLETHNQPWVDDPSNASDAYARNRLRRTMSETDFSTFWHEAQRAGVARHHDEQMRNDWLTTHATFAAGTLSLRLAPWAMLPEHQRTDVLSHAIRVIGAKSFRPRHHETARLDAAIAARAAGRATLGHCRIDWDRAQLMVQREPARAQGLEAAPRAPHMTDASLWKLLVSEPFWWFNYPLAP